MIRRQRARPGRRAAIGLALALMGCQPSKADAPDAGVTPAPVVDAGMRPSYAVHVRFEASESAQPTFGSQPWPNLTAVTEAGAPLAAPAQWPGRERVFVDGLLDQVGGLSGFGLQGPVLFEFDGEIDTDSLPSTAQDSTAEDASVFVVDIDTNSPDVFTRVPVRVRYDSSARRLSLIPAAGHLFLPGRRYAAVVTTGLRDHDGAPVGPSDAFADLLDMSPSDVGTGPANRYRAVLDVLATMGRAPDAIAGLSIFRVQSVAFAESDLSRLAAVAPDPKPFVAAWAEGAGLDELLGLPEQPVVGLDVLGGVLHSQQSAVIQLRVTLPHLLSAEQGRRGIIERDASGAWLVKRTEPVTVTLMMPRSSTDWTHVPVVLFAHGWGRERSDALALAYAFNRLGVAVVSIDAPNHGTRMVAADTTHRFGDADTPDGFGDLVGDPVGLTIDGEGILSLHPFIYRDLLRQWTLDWWAVLRILATGDLSSVRALRPDFAELGFDTQHVAMVGVDMGATASMMLATIEPSIAALVLANAGGHLQSDWLRMPRVRDLGDMLRQRLGVDTLSSEAVPFAPEVGLHRMLLDAVEPLAWASMLRRAPVHALLLGAADDELVSRQGVEALARVLGMDFEPSDDTGIEANPLMDENVSRGLVRFSPATHEALLDRTGRRRYDVRSDEITRLPEAETIDNPIDAMQDAVIGFYDDWRACLEQVSVSCSLPLPTE